MEEHGVVRTDEGQLRRIRIEAEDDCGNRSSLEFTVRGRSESFRAEADTAAVAIYPDRTSLVQVGREARASIPEGALYEPIFVNPNAGRPRRPIRASWCFRPPTASSTPTPRCGIPQQSPSVPACRDRCNCRPCWPCATAKAGCPASEVPMRTAP